MFDRDDEAVMECHVGVNRRRRRQACFWYDESNKVESVTSESTSNPKIITSVQELNVTDIVSARLELPSVLWCDRE